MATELQMEHFAINTSDPVAMARWYCEHLKMKIVRQGPEPKSVRFLADASDRVVMEIYRNPPDKIPDYWSMDPLILHLAFVASNVELTAAELVSAGAKMEGEIATTPDGDQIAMLRDPWGFCIQLCKRAQPMAM